MRACIVARLKPGGGIATGVDNELGECETRWSAGRDIYFAEPVAIEIGIDGRLLMIDSSSRAGIRRDDELAGLAVSVLTSGFGFVRQFHLPLEWGPGDPPYASWVQSISLAGAGAGPFFVGEVILSDDGTHSTGFRVRAFDPEGALLTTYGAGGDQVGTTRPTAPNVDADGRLWVIDLDTATRSYSIKVLE